MGDLPEISDRGVLCPRRLPPRFQRVNAHGQVADLVHWWWVSQWDKPPRATTQQGILAFPDFNLVVEPEFVGLSGPTTRASHRDLIGTGWAVAALLRPAAVPSFTSEPASLRDSYSEVAAPDLREAVVEAMGRNHVDDAVSRLSSWVTSFAGPVTDEGRLANRMAQLVGSDSAILAVGDLASTLHVSERTVHRLTERYVGLTPHALIRRRRLQEAAEHIRVEQGVSLAEVAAAHGFADQAHFAREFRRVLGRTAREYRVGFGRWGLTVQQKRAGRPIVDRRTSLIPLHQPRTPSEAAVYPANASAGFHNIEV